jgi:K+-transporting ATPase ATPase C chain
MLSLLRPALTLVIALTVLTGLLYPLAVTGIAQLAMPGAANGSLVTRENRVVGSALIGQVFTSERYFHPRPSATSAPDPNDPSKTVDAPYNAGNSGGSNRAPSNAALVSDVRDRVAALGGGVQPSDLVTASASGLDPHISAAAALVQVARVAQARGRPEAEIRALVERQTEVRQLGLVGEPRVNVLALNLALDALPAR